MATSHFFLALFSAGLCFLNLDPKPYGYHPGAAPGCPKLHLFSDCRRRYLCDDAQHRSRGPNLPGVVPSSHSISSSPNSCCPPFLSSLISRLSRVPQQGKTSHLWPVIILRFLVGTVVRVCGVGVYKRIRMVVFMCVLGLYMYVCVCVCVNLWKAGCCACM